MFGELAPDDELAARSLAVRAAVAGSCLEVAAGGQREGFYWSGLGVTWSALIGCSHVFGRRALDYWSSGRVVLGSCVELKSPAAGPAEKGVC